jgi:hypothetical protein
MAKDEKVNQSELPPVPTEETPPAQAETPPEPLPGTETEAPAKTESSAAEEVNTLIVEFIPDADLSTPGSRETAIKDLLTRFININNSLMDVVEDEPEFGMVLDDVLKGSKVASALARHYGPEAFSEPAEGEPDYEEFGKYKKERIEKRKKNQERRKMLQSNEEISLKEIDSYMEEEGLSPEQAQDFFSKADEFFKDVFDGKITKDHLAMLKKAFGYEDAVKEAEESGRIDGRNEQIVEQKVKKPVTSGMPEINEGGIPPPKSGRKGLLDELYG